MRKYGKNDPYKTDNTYFAADHGKLCKEPDSISLIFRKRDPSLAVRIRVFGPDLTFQGIPDLSKSRIAEPFIYSAVDITGKEDVNIPRSFPAVPVFFLFLSPFLKSFLRAEPARRIPSLKTEALLFPESVSFISVRQLHPMPAHRGPARCDNHGIPSDGRRRGQADCRVRLPLS